MSTVRDKSTPVQTNVSGTGAATIVPASGVSTQFRDLSGLVVTTANAAAATLTVSDGTKTVGVFNYPNAASAPSSPLALFFDPPMQQSVANAGWTLTASVNASNFNVTALYAER